MGPTLLDRKKVFCKRCIVAIGANLDGFDGATPLEVCERALRAVCATVPGLIRAGDARWSGLCWPPTRSRWYSSAPVPESRQPRYINGAVSLFSEADPFTILEVLQKIEILEGRSRGIVNAARTLDLDLIDVDGEVSTSPALILPHPRAHLRAFVLLPLRDVAPDWVHPVTGQTVHELVAGLPEQDIHPV